MFRVTALSGFGVGSVFVPVAGGAYVVTALTGTFTLNGQAATLRRGGNVLMTASTGSFALTGIDAILTASVGAGTGTGHASALMGLGPVVISGGSPRDANAAGVMVNVR